LEQTRFVLIRRQGGYLQIQTEFPGQPVAQQMYFVPPQLVSGTSSIPAFTFFISSKSTMVCFFRVNVFSNFFGFIFFSYFYFDILAF
jgi:hypothetical protein